MLVLLILSFVVAASALTPGKSGDCEVYEAELRSYPDFSRRVVMSSIPLPPDFIITDLQQDLSKGRSFYWCEMKVKHGDGLKIYRHFGHNSTTWWVTKGCGGWFLIKACRGGAGGGASQTDADNSVVDPNETPTTVIIVSDQKGGDKMEGPAKPPDTLQQKDVNHGALLSMFHWLAEQRAPLHEKLGGGSLNRVARSVDEEFAAEFGYD